MLKITVIRKVTVGLLVLALLTSKSLFSQERDEIRASRMSFRSAERHFSKGEFDQAARKYSILINLIPADIDSRRELKNRLESLIRLTDIYLNRNVEFARGCEYLNQYIEDMSVVRKSGVLRSSELLEFLEMEQVYVQKRTSVCERLKKSDSDYERMKKELEQEMK